MSLYKIGISDKTMGAMQNADPEVQQMILQNQQNNTQPDSGGGILDIIKELFGFGSAEASDLGAIANLGKTASTQSANEPFYKVSTMYDQIYSDPFNIKPKNSEIIIGADNKAKTVPILPMSKDEIMAGSIVPPDFNAGQFQSIFPSDMQTGIMSQAPLGFDTSFGVANEPDEEQVDFLGSKPNPFKEGIGKLFELFQKFSPIAAIGRGLESIRNRIDTNRAIQRDIDRDTQGTLDKTISPRIMNIKPTAQDKARGSIPSRTTSSPRRSSGFSSSARGRALHG
tara:strand:- start:83 stop:931 length:849 start_codon:yes stop_codon:yes gene_type:complete